MVNEFEEVENQYVLSIDNFNGPLELLWALIKKSKLDITEISIADVTEQYMNFLKKMDSLNISVAIEFIWMASELLFYKSKALLPTDKIDDEYFVPPLPPELIEKLLEFKKYQLASKVLDEKHKEHSDSFVRTNVLDEFMGKEEYIDVSLYDLLKALSKILEKEVTVEQEEIKFDEVLVSDRIDIIVELLNKNEAILLTDIFTEKPKRAEIVATFLAVLEMTKMHMIRIVQHKIFGDIRILRNFPLQDIS